MPISRKSVGTGITRSESISWTDEADRHDPEIATLRERSSLDGLFDQIERECFAIMATVGLPTSFGSWAYHADGEWHEIDEDHSWPEWSISNTHQHLADARGYEVDSPVGFAARMLSDIVMARRAFENDKPKMAALFVFYLGAKWSSRRIKEGWEAAAEAGKKVLDAAASTRKGSMSATERMEEVDRLVANNGIKKGAAFASVAEREGVTAKAIETDYYKAKKKAS